MAALQTLPGGLTATSNCSLGRRSVRAEEVRTLATPPLSRRSSLQAQKQEQKQWLATSPSRITKRRDAGIARASVGGTGALTPELKEALDKFLTANKVVLFMKGTKLFPQCGFSNTCVQILNLMSVPYETVNILEDEQLRQAMKEYSVWPTFPQLYIDGEFFGGCDITVESFQKGELKEVLEKTLLS